MSSPLLKDPCSVCSLSVSFTNSMSLFHPHSAWLCQRPPVPGPEGTLRVPLSSHAPGVNSLCHLERPEQIFAPGWLLHQPLPEKSRGKCHVFFFSFFYFNCLQVKIQTCKLPNICGVGRTTKKKSPFSQINASQSGRCFICTYRHKVHCAARYSHPSLQRHLVSIVTFECRQ